MVKVFFPFAAGRQDIQTAGQSPVSRGSGGVENPPQSQTTASAFQKATSSASSGAFAPGSVTDWTCQPYRCAPRRNPLFLSMEGGLSLLLTYKIVFMRTL